MPEDVNEPGPSEDPIGIADIAERLGVKRHTVHTWRYRGVMPQPRWTISGRPAWAWEDIKSWARKTGRLPS